MRNKIIAALIFCVLLIAVVSFNCASPIDSANMEDDVISLKAKINMPHVSGRIDHMAVNLKDKVVYMAALGNNTVEVIDLNKDTLIKSIKGVEEPQGIAYIPETNEIAVASGGNGDCVFFNVSSFEKVATVHLGSDADNIRYDAAEKKMYVGYGGGGMAMIDPLAHKQTGNVPLPAHPESFQLDKKNNKLYVNLPDDHSIAVIDLKSFTIIDTWRINHYSANFPMTLDTANDLVFVGYRHPALLVSYDSKSGKQVSTNELVGDVDDIFYYADKQLIMASGGDGYINIFKREADNTFKLVSNIHTRKGARTSLLIPSLGYYLLAERAEGGENAAVVVYKIQ